ncbi:MAG: hypothetical protein M3Q44_08310 [bacterium]|nr:hypothetical protein [bacterium]
MLHVLSIVGGATGIVTFIAACTIGANDTWLSYTREHLLLSAVAFFVLAIWLQVATMHHMMLEKKGEII